MTLTHGIVYTKAMKEELKEMMRQSVAGFHLPRYAEITDVGLYLEQVVKLINAYLAPLSFQGITGTMVSNYVKSKLLESPVKKQYYPQHIARLIFISLAKSVMTMEDIKLVMVLQQEQYPLPKAYNYFCDEFENMMQEAFGFGDSVDGLGETQSEAKTLLRTAIIAMVGKIYLDLYMGNFRRLYLENSPHSDKKE